MIDLGRSEEICREMDKLANEDHTHHITPDEIRVYRNNWWIRSNFVGSDTMPVRHRADFKQALSTLRHLKTDDIEQNATSSKAPDYITLRCGERSHSCCGGSLLMCGRVLLLRRCRGNYLGVSNRERSERLDITQDERKTSRSQEIDVNSFHEESVSSERMGDPLLKRV